VKTILSKPNTLANQVKALYPKYAQQKAVGLALVGYQFSKRTVRYKGFFCAYNLYAFCISMVKLGRDTFMCASDFESLSTNPFQLYHPHLVVNGKALLNLKGAHNHA